MADDSTAQFQEVLELRVDLDLFKQEMSKVADVYKESLSGIGNQTVGTGEIVQGLRDIQLTIEGLGSKGSKVLNDLTATMLDTAGSIEKGVSGINSGLTALGNNAGPATVATGIGAANTTFGTLVQSFQNIPNMITNVLALNLAWKVAGEAIKLVGEVILAPFKAIQEGVQYIRQLQTASADLQGVIAANITLSSDYPTNFRLAAVAAEEVRKKLQDIALVTGLTEQGLQSAFKQLLEAGGGSFVTSMDQLVQLTGLFGEAMKAAGKDVNATRTLLSEIPALLGGNEAPSSKLLEVLHLTKAEWEAIRVSALAHHDLLEQLAPILQPYIDVVGQAGTRQEVLINQLDLMKKRIEAAFSKEVFAVYTKALQEAKDLLAGHEDEVISIGRVFADLVVYVIQFGTALARIGGGEALGALAQLFNFIVFSIETALNGVVELSQLLYAMKDFDLTKPFQSIEQISIRTKEILDSAGQKFSDDLDRAAANSADIHENTTKYRDELDKKIASRTLIPAEAQGNVIYNPTQGGHNTVADASAGSGIPDYSALITSLPFLGSTPPPPKKTKDEKLAELRGELSDRIAAIKEEAQVEIDTINRLEHLKDISSQAASSARINLLKGQLADISKAADDVLAKGDASGLSAKQQTSLSDLVSKIKSTATRSEDKAVTTEGDKNLDQQSKAIDDELKREDALYAAHQKALLAIDQELLKEKLTTNAAVAQAEIDTDNRIYQHKLDTLSAQITKAKEDNLLTAKLLQEEEALEAAHTDKLISDSNKLKAARNKDRDEEFKYQNQVRQNQIQGLQGALVIGTADKSLSTQEKANLNVDISQAKLDDANAKTAQAQLAYAQILQQSAIYGNTNNQAVRDAAIALANMSEAAAVAADALKNAKQAASPLAATFTGLFGPGNDSLSKAFGGDQDSLGGKFEAIGNSVKNAVGVISGGISAIKQGEAQGGTLGGIGAGLSSFGGLIPVAGPFIQAAGAVMSLIGGLFTAQAQHIADEIKKNVDQTLKDINNNVDTSAQGLVLLEKQRQDAIDKLSGVKGGQDQLKKLLPGIDDAIASLKKQIASVKQTFEDTLAVLQAGGNSDVITKWVQDWQAINKQVKDYLDAVGAAGNANAQAFLTLELAKERQGLQTQYNQGEQTAISDALNLNSLLKQRNDLEVSFAQTRFNLLSADSVERRGSGAILAGQQLAQAAKDQKDQIANIDYQIAQATQKVTIEKQVFNIASDTATLQTQSLALQLIDLTKLKQTYIDIQNILAKTTNLIAGPNGSFFGTPLLPGVAPIPGFGGGNTPPAVAIGPIYITGANGKQIAGDLHDELQARFRGGLYSFQ